MGTLKDGLKHAFFVDPPGPVEPTAAQQAPVDWVCRQVARKHLTTPGLIALEMGRPLNYVAGQAMHVISPVIWALARQQTLAAYTSFAEFLERRGSIEYMAQRIEHFESEFTQQERDAKRGADVPAAEAREEDHEDDA